jgi:hypothetical protein
MALATKKTTIKDNFLTTRTMITGLPKTGKSTFASELGEGVYFLATEKGHEYLEVYKSDINHIKDFHNAVDELIATKDSHQFRTIVVDVLDKLMKLAEEEICTRNAIPKKVGNETVMEVPSINNIGGGFGEGQKAAMKLVMPYLDKLYSAGFGVTLICHPKEKEYKKELMSWTAMGLNMGMSYEKVFTAWVDLMLFAFINQNGERMLRTKPNKYVECAGDRSKKLPETMPLDAKAVMAVMSKAETPGLLSPAPIAVSNKPAATPVNIKPGAVVKNYAPQTAAQAQAMVKQ